MESSIPLACYGLLFMCYTDIASTNLVLLKNKFKEETERETSGNIVKNK